jgi:hypothetical protein
MTTSFKQIRIRDLISPDLSFRSSAEHFFNYLKQVKDHYILVDFINVNSMSRSFAHEYTINKLNSQKNIEEINVPSNIIKMFNVIQSSPPKHKLINYQ